MTEVDYRSGVERLQCVDPQNPLLPYITRGYGHVNCGYLKYALEGIQEPITIEEAKPANVHDVLAHLFGKQAKLSNSFHDCKSNAERERVSVAIEAVHDNIRRVKAGLDVQNNKPVDKEDPIPTDPLELMKHRNVLRTTISRKRKIINELMPHLIDTDPQHKTAQKRIEKHQGDLDVLENRMAHVERVIADPDKAI